MDADINDEDDLLVALALAGDNPIEKNSAPQETGNKFWIRGTEMIFGEKSIFAIKSEIFEFFPERGKMALGYFNVFVEGHRHGILSKEATLMARSYDAVIERLNMAGKHVSALPNDFDAAKFVTAYRSSQYGIGETSPHETYGDKFLSEIQENELLWAPDGDEAFDDGSHIFQIDVGNCVRLISFNNNEGAVMEKDSIIDLVVDAEVYYGALKDWSDDFFSRWKEYVMTVRQ